VVGGGDSALETAASLANEPGTSVALAYRGAAFTRAKVANRERIDRERRAGRVRVLLESSVLAIAPTSVSLRTGGAVEEIAADAVIVCTGGELPTQFLRAIGVETETKHGTPLH
jgi:thioredoxin reductase